MLPSVCLSGRPEPTVGHSADDNSTRALLFRLLRLTKLLRIPNVLQTSNVRTYLSAKVLKQKGLVSLITLLAAVLVVIHHAACYFYFIGVVATGNAMRNIPELVDIETGNLIHQSWVEAEELESYYKFGRYVMALYWAMYTFLTVGYGDIAIFNTAEKIWAIITAVTGVVMAGWFMGAVGAFMGGTGGAEAEMQQRRQDVFQFIQKRRLRGDLAARVQKYEGGIMWRQLSDKDRQIIDGLPRMLRTEVVLHIYDKVVRKVSFMQTRPPQFIVELLLRLRLRLYDKGDYIVREGEMGGEIYFLAAGEAEVRCELPPNENEDHDLAHLTPTVGRRRSQAGDRLRHLSRIVIIAGRSISNALARASLNPPAPPAATAGADPAADPAAGAGAGAAEGVACASSQHFSGLGRLSRGAGMGAAAAGAVAAGATAGPRGASSFQSGAVGASGGSCPADVLTRLVRSVPPQGRRPAAAAAATEQGHGYVILGHIQTGGLFGHVSCLAGEVRRNSIVATSAEGCEVLVLSKEDAEQLAKDWPDIYDDPAMHLDRGRRRSACLNDTLPAFVEHYVPLAGGPLPARRRGAAAAGSLGRNSHRHGGGRATAQPLGRLSLGRVPEQRVMSTHQLGQLAAGGGAPFARASDMRTLSVWERGREGEAGGGGGVHGSGGGGAVTERTAPPGQPNSEQTKEQRPTGQSAQPQPQPQQQPQALLEEKPAVEGPCVPSGGGDVAAGIDGGAANRNIGGQGLGRGGGFVAAEGSSAVNHGSVEHVRGDGACGGDCAGGGRAGAAVAVLEMELQPREGE